MVRAARRALQASIRKGRDGFLRASPACAAGALVNLAERSAQRERLHTFPRILQIEVTNRCNLNCVFCSRYSHKLKLGDMPRDLYPALEEISGHVLETNLTGYGEPMVSEAFYDLLQRVSSARISFITNGLALTQEALDRILSLANRPLYSIAFSVDGSRPETYNSIRKRSDFHTVWRNLEHTAARGRDARSRFETWINFVAIRRNAGELPELIERAAAAGVSRVIVFHLVVWDARHREESLLGDPELCARAFDEARRAAARHGIHVDLPVTFPGPGAPPRAPLRDGAAEPACHMPWSYVYVRYDGSVHACCNSESFVMGNLYENRFAEIWNNPRYRSLRRSINHRLPRDCGRCEQRYRYARSPDDEQTYIKLKPRSM